MRVDALNQISKIYQANNTMITTKIDKAGTSDKFELSGLGQDIQTVTQALKDIPEIREDKVVKIKSEIEGGTYKVSDDDLAQKLIEQYENNQ